MFNKSIIFSVKLYFEPNHLTKQTDILKFLCGKNDDQGKRQSLLVLDNG